MTKKKYHGVGIGSTSIIMIFVVLCLTTFSLLSFSSANSGWKFAERSSDQTVRYFKAQNAANDKLAEIDAFLYDISANEDSYFFNMPSVALISGVSFKESYEYFLVSYSVPISTKSVLYVELEIPFSPSEERFVITKWNTKAEEFDYNDDRMNIWDGLNIEE